MKNLLYISALLFSISGFCQTAPPIKWQNSIGGSMSDFMYSLLLTNEGGYILAGRSVSDSSGDKTENSPGGADYWILKTDTSGNILLQNTIGGSGTDDLKSIVQTYDGGYLLGGYSDSNISGDKTENTWGGNDYWIVKVDSLFNIQWQNTIGGTGLDYLHAVIQTTDSGYLLSGYSDSNHSIDKHEDTIGGFDYWIVKTDASGNIQWENTIGGSGDEYYQDIKQTNDGGFIIAGRSESNISGDKTENSNGQSDLWIVKTDSGGTIQWQNTIGGNGTEDINSVAQTFDGGYILGGISRSNISGDKTENCHGNLDFWIVKIDSAGVIQWQNTIGGNNEESINTLQQTADSGYVFGGFSSSPVSADKTEKCLGRDFFIVKTDDHGNIEWQNSIGGSGEDWMQDLRQTNDGYILGGYSNSNISGEKTENCVGWFDYWLIKLTDEFNTISGKLFIDGNSNGIRDTGEIILSGKKITETNTGRLAISAIDGKYELTVFDSGNFIVTPETISYYSPSPSVNNSYFPNIHLTDSLNDFAYQPAGIFNDLCLTITPVGPFRTGFNATYIISYENYGTTSLSPTVIFYPDSGLAFVSSTPAASTVTSDSVVWNLGTLSPYHSGNIIVTVNVGQGIAIGTVLNSGAQIEPVAGDANPGCNDSYYEAIVRGSFDPNEILVDKKFILEPDLLNPPFIEYIIYFQNTGTDTAFNIKILNPIDTFKLNLSSFELVESSSPVNIQFKSWEKSLEFSFNSILLPDSNINEAGSHGFVRYRVKPKSSLLAGDTIFNSVYIYFDFNNPITTNTVSTAILQLVSIKDVEKQNQLIIYPNPVRSELNIGLRSEGKEVHLKIYDLIGKQVYSESFAVNKKHFETKINLDALVEGIYILNADDDRNHWHSKFIKH